MAKPTIVTRAGKGSALTWTEGDANLTNLRDATFSVTDGTNTHAFNLNDSMTLTAGTNMSVAVNSATGAVTISTSATTNTGTVTSVAALTLGTTGTDVSSTVATGTTTPVITLNIPTASATNRGALSSSDWTTFNGKQSALVSGTSIKTVNSNSLLGSGNLAVGTVTSVGGTGTVNGLTLTGTVTSSGSLTLGGTLDLTAPPAIGGTTPAAGTFTSLTASSLNASVSLSPTGTGTVTLNPATAGTINNMSIGATTASTGKFTSLTATGTTTLATSLSGLLKAASGVVSAATAGTDYVAVGGALGTPSSGTVTNLTGTASININGTVGATTPSTGAFTTLSASSTVSGTGFSTYLASPPAIGGTTAAAGSFTTLSSSTTGTSGAVNVTYTPATASGAAIQTTGKDTQGGTGYFDFLKATNTTTGVTNGNKTIRLNSTGTLEIINSGYTATLLSLTDAGALTFGGTTFPTSTGTNGQVLTANGSGGATWAAAGGGSSGNNIIILSMSSQLSVPSAADSACTPSWTIESSGGVSGVSVGTGTITLPAGSYIIELPIVYCSDTSNPSMILKNNTAGTTLATIDNTTVMPITVSGTSRAIWWAHKFAFTLASTSTIQFYKSGSYPSFQVFWNESRGGRQFYKIYKTA